jgi:GNAT superfamily N-acetyltransferase
MNSVSIERITAQDLPVLQAISRQTFFETFSPVNTEENMTSYLSESLSLEKLKSEFDSHGSEFYFATIESRIIGYLKLNFGAAQTEQIIKKGMEIERIYVLQEFQGHKVGQLLFEYALQRARQLASESIWLGVWEKNTKAIQFYFKNGFVQFDTHIFKLGEDEQTDLLMKLQLQY